MVVSGVKRLHSVASAQRCTASSRAAHSESSGGSTPCFSSAAATAPPPRSDCAAASLSSSRACVAARAMRRCAIWASTTSTLGTPSSMSCSLAGSAPDARYMSVVAACSLSGRSYERARASSTGSAPASRTLGRLGARLESSSRHEAASRCVGVCEQPASATSDESTSDRASRALFGSLGSAMLRSTLTACWRTSSSGRAISSSSGCSACSSRMSSA